MSLLEQYQSALSEKNEREKKEQVRTSIRDYFQGLGLVGFDEHEPLYLPISPKSKINEIISLIKKEKWLETRLFVTTEDIRTGISTVADTIVPSVSNSTDRNTPRLIKYKLADGTVHIGELADVHIPNNIYKRRHIKRFIDDINLKYKCLTKHLYGTQKFVILVVKLGTWDDGGDKNDYLALFEDGDLFLIPSSYSYNILRKHSCEINEHAIYCTTMQKIPLDEILLSNLIRINHE